MAIAAASNQKHPTSTERAPLPATSWEKHQRRRIWIFRFLLALLLGLTFDAIWRIGLWLFPANGAQIVAILFFEIKIIDYLIKLFGIKEFVFEFCNAHPIATCFISGFFRPLVYPKVERIYEVYFSDFNYGALHPIRRPKPFDPLWGTPDLNREKEASIKWLEPGRPGPRKTAWDALNEFAFRLAGDGRTSWWKSSDIECFQWTVVTGRAGSGKTRMVMEFARQLARRKELGDDSRVPFHSRYRLQLCAWWRRALPPLRWRVDDPWDAGWLKPSISRGLDEHKLREKFAIHTLSEWRPRRPTILLLDDPRLGDSERVVDTLLAQHKNYRYAVRLIIANQAIPKELEVRREDDGTRWLSETNKFSGEIIALTGAARLDADEIRTMAADLDLHGQHSSWRGDNAQISQLENITRGNALLVELALRALKMGARLYDMTEDSLLEGRARRINEALDLLGIGSDDHRRALACATIAGPSDSETRYVRGAMKTGSSKLDAQSPTPAESPIESAFPLAQFDRTKIQLLFSITEVANDDLPPVRPELIGDAFVRLIFDGSKESQQKKIITTAWRTNAGGTLRTALRLARQHNRLGQALQVDPPEGLELDRMTLLLALAREATQVAPDDWEAGEFDDGKDLLVLTLRRIGTLPPDLAARNLTAFAALMDIDRNFSIVRGWPGFACFGVAVNTALKDERAFSDPDVAHAAISAMIFALRSARQWDVSEPAHESPNGRSDGMSTMTWDLANRLGELIVRLAKVPELELYAGSPVAENIARAAWQSGFMVSATAAKAVLHSLSQLPRPDRKIAPEDGSELLAAVRRIRLEAMKSVIGREPDAAAETATKFDSIISTRFLEHREFQLERAKVWAVVAVARQNHPSACLEAAQKVDSIVLPRFAGNRDFEYERLQAWRSVVMAFQNDPVRCDQAATEVDSIVRPAFEGQQDFVLEYARAIRFLAISCCGRPVECNKSVQELDSIVLPAFAGQREFEYERAVAYQYLSLANLSSPAECLQAVRQLDLIVKPVFAGLHRL